MSQRWQGAQRAERAWWAQKKHIVLSPKYRCKIEKRAKKVENWLKKFKEIKKDSNILEIGGGATQLVDYFSSANKFAIDPLADFYLNEFSHVLAPDVDWSKGKGEALPYKDNFFDVIISRNVLDHVDSVEKSLLEIKRVLKEDGVFYLGLHSFSGPLYLYKIVVKEEAHPVVFTPSKIENCLKESGFEVIDSIFDTPENMEDFIDEIAATNKLKSFLRDILLSLHCYHFSEFLLKVSENNLNDEENWNKKYLQFS